MEQYGRPGIVLMVTLVLLVVLSALMYTLSIRMSSQRHRDRYIIDYQAARYGCDSAVKYALATLDDINTPRLISRPNEPDFSDLFMLDEEQYRQLLAEWNIQDEESLSTDSELGLGGGLSSRNLTEPASNDVNGFYDINDPNSARFFDDSDDPNTRTVPGPYGPPWPYITEPIELEIGSAKVRIEIEDENAKYPVGWLMMDNRNIQREVTAGFETFCEWMDVNEVQLDLLEEQFEQIKEIKPFKIDFKTITTVVRQPVSKPKTRTSTRRTSRSRVRPPAMRTKRTTISVDKQVAEQSVDFAKLCHSTLLDTEMLARPIVLSEIRKESALKYMGMWATRKVNINTAPRHVLEAAFAFGGDADIIAEEIIQLRRIKPFASIEDLRRDLFRYSDSIEKSQKYITTVSQIFTIKVTASSGVAETSAVIGIVKDGNRVKRIAVISI
ncbi:MAG: hypothetical protein BBJ57_00800 [Desulfobacterales bacterium PC51MH44]|nr:MAG: hypothetical protein BBJ57_00800 [Desulfobacterales bacterium PC51MH44]